MANPKKSSRGCTSSAPRVLFDLYAFMTRPALAKHPQRRGWYTLRELANAVGLSETGVSARLRDFRKLQFARFFPQLREVQLKPISVNHRGFYYRLRISS